MLILNWLIEIPPLLRLFIHIFSYISYIIDKKHHIMALLLSNFDCSIP